nr:helix-turn-helix domain-containing protein [Deltaproteobacteria bacterium]
MLGEREFTSEEVARYCGVTRPAVVSWIDRSLLPAHRTGGGHRRILRPDLARFLEQQGYEVPPEVSRVRPLLFAVGGDPVNSDVLAGVFAQDFEVHAAAASIDVLLSLGTLRPDVLVAAIPMPALDGARLSWRPLAALRWPTRYGWRWWPAPTRRRALVARGRRSPSPATGLASSTRRWWRASPTDSAGRWYRHLREAHDAHRGGGDGDRTLRGIGRRHRAVAAAVAARAPASSTG